jgi:hypothetical protein
MLIFTEKKRRYHPHKLIALRCMCKILSVFLKIRKRYSFGEAIGVKFILLEAYFSHALLIEEVRMML